jgi:hypothetical protein
MNADVDFGSRSIADVASSFLAQHRNELATRTSVRDAGPLDAAGALP